MKDSFKTRQKLAVGEESFEIFRLPALEGYNLDRLPFSLKILLENLLRHEDGVNVTANDVEALLNWDPKIMLDASIDETLDYFLQDYVSASGSD